MARDEISSIFRGYRQIEGRIPGEQPRHVPTGGNCRVQREVIALVLVLLIRLVFESC